MTPEQIKMARHALGLPNDRRKSFRNRYCAGRGSTADRIWLVMVRDCVAVVDYATENLVHFSLNFKGAQSALEAGETLDIEDFFPELRGAI